MNKIESLLNEIRSSDGGRRVSGNGLLREGFHYGDRYAFDSYLLPLGYWQINNRQDASYYGSWVNLDNLEVIDFMEGDVYVISFENEKSVAENIKAGRDSGITSIDAGLKDENLARCKAFVEKYGIFD